MRTLTKKDFVQAEINKGVKVLHEAGFSPDQIRALMTATLHAIDAAELQKMDHRLIEGDDESEIRGY